MQNICIKQSDSNISLLVEFGRSNEATECGITESSEYSKSKIEGRKKLEKSISYTFGNCNLIDLETKKKWCISICPRSEGVAECYVKRDRSGNNDMYPTYLRYLKNENIFLMTSNFDDIKKEGKEKNFKLPYFHGKR